MNYETEIKKLQKHVASLLSWKNATTNQGKVWRWKEEERFVEDWAANPNIPLLAVKYRRTIGGIRRKAKRLKLQMPSF